MVMAWTSKKVVIDVSQRKKKDNIWINKVSEQFKLGVYINGRRGKVVVSVDDWTGSPIPTIDITETGKCSFIYSTGEFA
jgi:hypothetical protein